MVCPSGKNKAPDAEVLHAEVTATCSQVGGWVGRGRGGGGLQPEPKRAAPAQRVFVHEGK